MADEIYYWKEKKERRREEHAQCCIDTLPTDWRTKSTDALLSLLLKAHTWFKFVGPELDGRPPDEAAARRLVAAYEAGDAEPWFTAYLLGCIGHEAGYETVKAILRAGPRRLAESYAGPALAKIRGPAAHEDLVQLMNESASRRSREGAAYGLAHLGTGQAADAIIDAAVLGKIRTRMGSVLAKLPVEPTTIAALLEGDLRSVRVGIEFMCTLWGLTSSASVARSRKASALLEHGRSLWLEPVRRILNEPELRMAPWQRKQLTAWVAAQSPE